MDIGADVLGQYFNSPAVQQTAQRRGKYSVGAYSDMSAFAPKAHLTAPIFNWSSFYKKIAGAVHDGTWKSAMYSPSMKDGVAGLAPYGPMVPHDTREMVDRKKAELIAGKFTVLQLPCGPTDGPASHRSPDP